MKKKPILKKNTNRNQNIWMGTAVILALGGLTYWLIRSRKKEEEEILLGITEDSPKETKEMVRTSRFKCVNRAYPLGYGTCHKDVELLQGYLKIYNEDLGSSGKNKDGIDGMLGSKTAKAARKRLGKSSFTKEDIAGMKNSLKMIKV